MNIGRTALESVCGRAIGPVGYGLMGLTIPWVPVGYSVAADIMKKALVHELNPIGRGWLTGDVRKPGDLPQNDFRRHMSRFKPDVFDQHFKLVEAVEQMAKNKGVTTARVAIARVSRQGAIPIPGSTKIERVVQNSMIVPLTVQDMVEIQKILESLPIAGERYGGASGKLLNA